MKKVLRIVGILVVIAGIGCIFFSHYITTQVNEGKIKIEKGQKSVDQSSGLFFFKPLHQAAWQGDHIFWPKEDQRGQGAGRPL